MKLLNISTEMTFYILLWKSNVKDVLRSYYIILSEKSAK